ncbi:MAG: bifunctional oligoribonuclease/PAP phosphatase NrnA [Clostridiales bacterium]
MKKNNSLTQIKQIIDQSNNLLIVSHILPDGDNIGSVLGLSMCLQAMGKKVTAVANGAIPKYYEFLPNVEILISPENVAKDKYDLVIALDMSDCGRGGNSFDFIWQGYTILNIDHHISNDFFGDYNYVQPEAAATAQILTEILLNCAYPITTDIATDFYVGILTDSGNFTYSSTSDKTLSLAAELLKYNPDLMAIRMNVFENVSFKRKKILGKALVNAKEIEPRNIVYSTLNYEECQELEAEGQDFEGIIDHLIGVTDIRMGIFFREMEKNIIKVGFRGKPGVDVTVVAGEFGGGGHKAAGGCTVEATMGNAVERVISLAVDYMESGI